MTREQILSEYTVNEHGIIQNPGKFESEMLYAPYFYDAMLNGFGDETLADNSELFELTSDDRAMFPELGSDKYLVLSESDQGFVSTDTTDDDPRDAYLSDDNEDSEEFSEPEEDDITTSDHLHFYQSGKLWLTITEDQDMAAAVKAQMETDQFWPNVWFISDHGNSHLMSLDS